MDIVQMGSRIILGFILGAVIGLEREINEKKTSNFQRVATATLGIRSFSLTTALGVIAGIIHTQFVQLALLIGAAFFFLVLIFYYLDSNSTEDHGFTTELAAIYGFVIGLLIGTNIVPAQLVIAITIIVILLLSQKTKIKDVIEDVNKSELNAFISYAILAAVIMPFLPNTNYSIADLNGLSTFLKNISVPISKVLEIDIINPFKIWVVLVLITGVDLISYTLSRILGKKKGWIITSILGGFVSSTSTTQSIAQQSKKTQHNNHLVAAAVVSNMASFFQIAFLIGLVNGNFFIQLWPILGAMILMSAVIVIYFLKKREKINQTTDDTVKEEITIIDLSAALRFVGLYLGISILSKIGLVFFGNNGFLILVAIGAMIGLDAVMINTSQLAGTRVSYDVAVSAFIIANTVNLAAKSIYCRIAGSKLFSKKFTFSMALIILSSFVCFLMAR